MKSHAKLSIVLRGIIAENPVLILVLGTCPTLAQTGSVIAALSMGIAATLVLICSNAVIRCLARPKVKPISGKVVSPVPARNFTLPVRKLRMCRSFRALKAAPMPERTVISAHTKRREVPIPPFGRRVRNAR